MVGCDHTLAARLEDHSEGRSQCAAIGVEASIEEYVCQEMSCADEEIPELVACKAEVEYALKKAKEGGQTE